MFAAILLVSCDRVKKLQEERQKVDLEAERALAETQALDQRILSLGTLAESATITIQRQTAALEQKVAALQTEVNAMKAKVNAVESAMATYGPKVDAYKAKYLR